MGPLPWCVCWCTRVFAGELWGVWGCHDAVKLVLWPKNADGAMGFGVPARTLLEVDSTVRRESPRKQRPPAELKQLYKCTGGPRIRAPHNAPAARKLGLTVRVAANCGMDSIQPGGVGTECPPRKRKAGRFVKDAGIAKAAEGSLRAFAAPFASPHW